MATFLRLSSCSSSAIVDMEKVVSISSGDLLYRELLRPNWSSFPDPDNLRSWLLRTKQLSMLRLGLWCCWSARKTRFCGTQPETIWFLWWRKLSRPKDTPLRVGCWTMGVRVFPKAWPWPVPAKRSSWSWFLLFSWSWLILIWMARNLLSMELGESGTWDPWREFSHWCCERLAESLLLSLGSL